MIRSFFSRGLLMTWIEQLRTDPVQFFLSILVQIPALLLALILHEMAHGYVALWCGDPTAKMLGRLSINPARHLDPIGSLCMVLFGFGWAKPVPVNPRNFRNYRRDDLFVSLAGVTMNLALFLTSSFLLVATARLKTVMRFADISLRVAEVIYDFFGTFASINLSLSIFNLLPIPPLDGYHVVNDTILRGRLHLDRQKLFICQMVFMAVLYFTPIITNIISAVHGFLWTNVIGFYVNIFF